MLTITNEDNMVLMARYPDNYFDLAIVDPPYGINIGTSVGGGSHLVKVGAENLSRPKSIGGLMIVNPLNKNTFKNYRELVKIKSYSGEIILSKT
jgi:DNA modification methylase